MGRRSRSAEAGPISVTLQAAHLVEECDNLDEPELKPRAKRQRTGKQTGISRTQRESQQQQQAQVAPISTAGENQENGKGSAVIMETAFAVTANVPAADEAEEDAVVDTRDLPRKGSSGASRDMEKALWAQGYAGVCGLDEAGRGPWAGPVVAGACVLPPGIEIPGLNDSKQLKEAEREALYEVITTTPGVLWAVAEVDSQTIDAINILQASLRAMATAAGQLPSGGAHYYLVDGPHVPRDLGAPAEAVVKGDARVTCIAAASILAKVTRDRIMAQLDAQYPQFGFGQHKGYGVPAHKAALSSHPPCPVHRFSYKPVAAAAEAWGIELVKPEAGNKSKAGKRKAEGKTEVVDAAEVEEEAQEEEGRGRRGRGKAASQIRQKQQQLQQQQEEEEQEGVQEDEGKHVQGRGRKGRGVLQEVQHKQEEGKGQVVVKKTTEKVVEGQENVEVVGDEGGRPKRSRKASVRLEVTHEVKRVTRRSAVVR